jgi:STIP1 homology and U-box containing protein 1
MEKFTKFPFEVPDHFCCKITFEIMEEPYITPAGNTYEGAYLMQHIEKNGAFDPITR